MDYATHILNLLNVSLSVLGKIWTLVEKRQSGLLKRREATK